MKISVYLLFILTTFSLKAQLFTETDNNFFPMYNCNIALGDYDNDGDLDIAYSGNNGEIWNYYTKIYRNDEGVFYDTGTEISGTHGYNHYNLFTGLSFGDFDNDDDLDLLISSAPKPPDYLSNLQIFRNDNGTFCKIDIVTDFSEAYWFDFNKDNMIDILGKFNNYHTIFLNNSSEFAQTTYKWFNCYPFWVDFDNNSSIDAIMSIHKNNTVAFHLFENVSNTLVLKDTVMPFSSYNLYSNSLFFDFDGDYDMDFLSINNSNQSTIYKNNNSKFEPFQINTVSYSNGKQNIFDYDNDADFDIIYIYNSANSKLFENNNSFFTEVVSGLPNYIGNSNFAIGDFDNDGDPDVFITGYYYKHPVEYEFTALYRNNLQSNVFTPNTVPTAPINLQTTVVGDSVVFTWESATDSTTPQQSLTYNMYVGTSAQGTQIMSPMANIETGFRKVVQMGNTQLNKGWFLRRLAPGTYYWSVQAIDNSFAGGQFAQEQTFTIEPQGNSFLYDNSCFSLATNFSFNHTNNIQTVVWHFGDGTQSTDLEPSHLYAQAASFTVSVTITYTDLTSETITKTIEIKEKPITSNIFYD